VTAEKFAISVERAASAVWSLLKHPHRVIFVSSILGFVPWLELILGWVIDLMVLLLLRKQVKKRTRMLHKCSMLNESGTSRDVYCDCSQ